MDFLFIFVLGYCSRDIVNYIKHLVNFINVKKRIHLEYMDLTDYSSVENSVKKIKPDIIFHLAAQSFPKASFDMREVTFDTNILGTDRLLSLIHISEPTRPS